VRVSFIISLIEGESSTVRIILAICFSLRPG
jgi:hypothetical protein